MAAGFIATYANSAYHHWRGVLDTTLSDTDCQLLATGRWFSLGTPVSYANKTDRSDVPELLLKMTLNTITLTTINPESRTSFVVNKYGENTSCVSRLEYIPHSKDEFV
jgi:hypothetical protein